MVPIPTAPHTPRSARSRGEIEKRSLRFLQAGSTTREDVLLEFGEPDAVSRDGRYFLYRWITVAGYVLWGTYSDDGVERMGTRRHDMVLEFDPNGVLVRYGDLETLVTEPMGEDAPVDPTLPADLPVLFRAPRTKDWESATLHLEDTRLAVLLPGSDDPALDIPLAAIVHFHHRSDDAEDWYEGWLHYRLEYSSAGGKMGAARLQINALDLPKLAKYLQDHSPGVHITD